MKMLQAIILVWMLLTAKVLAQEPKPHQPTPPPSVRFEAVDVYVDSGDVPLAAYQFELAAETGEITIVGIEGGEHPAFKEPPYYDPAALSKGRIIIAAFNTGRDLPKGKTRVARIHVQVLGEARPQYVIEVKVTASAEGRHLWPTVTATRREDR